MQAGYATITGTSGSGDYLAYEYWSDTPTPALPLTGAVEASYSTCTHCVFVYENCTSTTCAKYYMGQSGTASLTAFTADEDAGSVGVTLTDVTFVEWDTQNDVAVSNGACLHLSSQTLSASW